MAEQQHVMPRDWGKIAELMRTRLPRAEVLVHEPMSEHTSFRVGGPADILVRPYSTPELRDALLTCHRLRVDPVIIGNGTNLLVSDRGIRGVVIQIGDNLSGLHVKGRSIAAEAGISLAKLAAAALAHRLSGLEFASGIPGTLGGAVVMNAGAYGGEMKDVVKAAECFEVSGQKHRLTTEQLGFGYRRSVFQHWRLVVARVELELVPGDPEEIRTRMRQLNARRREKQPLHLPSAGSVFKRPPGHYAGKLIEDAGLKGFRIGNAQVSEMHCGFIVNLGGAKAADILQLIRHVQAEVKRQFGVNLEPEVRLVGDWEGTDAQALVPDPEGGEGL